MEKVTITALKRQKRHPKKVSLFLDGKFACGLDEEILFQLKLKKGQEIVEKEILSQVILKEGIRKGKDYALRLLAYRPRSCWEIRARLGRKKYSPADIEEILEQLKAGSFLDDYRFAHSWAESRFLNKPIGRRRLEQELIRKGINEKIISKVCQSAYGEEKEREMAFEVAARRMKSYRDLDKITARRRLHGYLARRGFPFEIIAQVLEEYWKG